MFHNHTQKEIIQKFLSIDTTFIDLFGSNNNNSVMFGATNISCMNSMIQYPHSSTNAMILSKNYDNNTPVTSLVAGINNRKTTNRLKSQIYKISPTDFTLHLPETLTNVVQMKVCAVDLPHKVFNISPFYNNNCVYICDTGKDDANYVQAKIELPSGNYTTDEIITILNYAIENSELNGKEKWRFFYNKILGRVFFSFADKNIPNEIDKTLHGAVTLKFSNETESCDGPKKYMSLGTILGFRKKEYKHDIDYLDFQNINKIMVNNGVSQYSTYGDTTKVGNETCNWPDYSKTDSTVPIISINTVNPQGFIAEGAPEESSYVWLIIDDFVKEQKTEYMVVSTNRSQINSAKIYCKLPIRNGRIQFDTAFFVDDYKREYFNPTNIDKLQIKIIEPSGITTYMAHSNLNLDIQFSCLR